MEILIGMLFGLALGVAVSYVRILVEFRTFLVILAVILVPITFGILWLVAIPIAAFVYDMPTVDVWRRLVLANMVFCAIGMIIMRYILKEMAKQMQEKENETSIE